LNWVGGQSWFDLHLPRLYPQHLITMHWGRLPDSPLAGFFFVLRMLAIFFRWQAEAQSLAMLTAFLWPPVLLGLLLFLMREIARPLMGKARAPLICFFVPLCTQLIFQFMPMRVDHHAYILLSAAAAFFCLQGMALHIRTKYLGVLAGLALGVAMWNGAEILPMVVFFCLALTALAILERKNFESAALFGFSFMITNFLILFIARAPDQRWGIEYDAFSFFYVILAGLVAGYFTLLLGAARLTKNRIILSALAIFISLCGVAALLRAYPDFIFGPYAKANPVLENIFFPNIREAIPLLKSWADIGESFNRSPNQSVGGALYYIGTRMFISVAGIVISLFMTFRGCKNPRRKRLWALYAFFSLAYGILTMVWQVRVITYAQLFAVAPLCWLVPHYLAQLPRHYQGRKLFTFEVLTVFALTLFPVILIPSIINQNRFMPDMLFFLGKAVDTPCNNRINVVAYLRDLAEREKKTATIMAPMDYTPALMFYTSQNYIAAPYHRNDRGILDMVMFFRSKAKDEGARAIAKRLGLDYVLLCKASYFQGTLSRSPEIQNVRISMVNNKMEAVPEDADLAKASLGMRLAYGKAPGWLQQRDIPFETDFVIFQVKKKKL
ncbi:MAG: hypothetical protein HY053_00355, partial [Proteobacteria bacterium]|nr:hypothetical protein [Pseudomonadota bacterium]